MKGRGKMDKIRTMYTKRYLLLAVMALVFLNGCALGLVRKEKPAPAQETGLSAGQEPPEGAEEPAGDKAHEEAQEASSPFLFEGQDMEGERITSEVLSESELTMINVWATYCNPCLREMPGLGELAGEYDKKDFQIIGIISDVQEGADQSAVDLAGELIEKTGAAYPHLLLNESLYRGLLKDVTAVPTTFFINGDGEIVETVVGSMEKSDWKEKIDGLLAR